MARTLPRLAAQAAPIVLLAGAGVLALRGPRQAGDARRGGSGRGRRATSPLRIPLKGWKDILIRTRKEFIADRVTLIGAGVAFFTLLALFPGIAAFVALYGLFADVAQAQHQLQMLSPILPSGAAQFIGHQMIRLAAAQKGGLSLAFVAGLLTSIWSANGAVKAMMTGLNVAYEETERRSFVRRTLISLAFTLGLLVFGIAAIAFLGLGPLVKAYLGGRAALVTNLVSWPILLVALAMGLALLYRYGPSRSPPRFEWISWGSAAAILLWLMVSVLFSLYVGNFAHYGETYGSLGAAVGLMMWCWLSSLVVLLGAEINSEVEHQTEVDKSAGARRPMGARDARMADTFGPAQAG